jgi:GH18 family chitinase
MATRSSNNPYGTFTEGTDKRIGDAFPIIEAVYKRLSELMYLVDNAYRLQPGQVELRYVEETKTVEWSYTNVGEWHVLFVNDGVVSVDPGGNSGGGLPLDIDALLSDIMAQLALKANIVSPTFTGAPKAPTPVSSSNDTSIATTSFVKTVVNALEIPPPEESGSLSLFYSGSLSDGILFTGSNGLPDNAVVTSVLVASNNEAGVYIPTNAQGLSKRNIYLDITANTVEGTATLPVAVAAGEWVPSPPKEPLAPGKFMGAYWGDYTMYKGIGRLGTIDFMSGLWTANADQTLMFDPQTGAAYVPEHYWNLDYISEPNMMGGNVPSGGTRVALASQLSHLFYAFFFPNCTYAEWLRLVPYMEFPPPSVFGTIEEAVAAGGTNRGAWSSSASYVTNDVVLHDDVYYAALCANTNQNPYWLDATSGVSSLWIAGSYFAPPSDGGVLIPTYTKNALVKPLPLVPGTAYSQTAYLGNITPVGGYATVKAFISAGGVGPGTVWRTDATHYWCGLNWAGYWADPALSPGDGSQHTQGAGTPDMIAKAHRRIYWRTIIPRGALVPTDTDTWQKFLKKMPALRAANPALKFILSVGGWSRSHYLGIVGASPTLRETFVNSCMAYCKKFLSDGIDMDWETPGGNGDTNYIINNIWPDEVGYAAMRESATTDPTLNTFDKDGYTAIMSDLRSAFNLYVDQGGRYLELSSAIVPGDYALYNVMDSFQYQDNIMLMSYIFYGTWQPEILPFAGLYKAAGHPEMNSFLTVDGFAQRVTNSHNGVGGAGELGTGKSWAGGTFELTCPKNKVVIGTTSNGVAYAVSTGNFAAVPVADGYEITGVNNGGATPWKSPAYNGSSFIDEDALYYRYISGELTRYWDAGSKTAIYAVDNNSGKEVISADDVTGFWHKAHYVVTEGYRGMMIWEVSGDTKFFPSEGWPVRMGGLVEDADHNQFNGVDTMVYVMNRGATGGASGTGDIVLSRTSNNAAGTPTLVTFSVENVAATGIKVTYEIVTGGNTLNIPATPPTEPPPEEPPVEPPVEPPPVDPVVTTSPFYWYGDSLSTTQWDGSGVGPTLSTLLSQPVVVKAAVGMQSQEIAVRFGGRSSLFTVEGNLIPASGPVNVTSRVILPIGYTAADRVADPCYSTAVRSVPGTLAGVNGTYTSDGGRVNYPTTDPQPTYWRFTRDTAGATVAVPPKTPFIIDVPDDRYDATCIIWMGTNNMGWWLEEDGVLNDFAGCVAAMTNTPKRFILLGPITFPYWVQWLHDQVAYVNNALTSLYGDNYINVMQLLLANGNGSAGDNADIAANLPPRSLRTSQYDGHLNTAGSNLVATAVFNKLTAKGWIA